MKQRIGFVIEQALGHVAYGMGIRHALSGRNDIDPVWIDIPYAQDGFGRVPVVGRNWTLRGSVRAYRAIEQAHREKPFDALFLHTQTISLFSSPHMRRTPTLLSLDATPINYDELASSYGDKVHAGFVERAKLWAHRSVMRNVRKFTTWSQWAKKSLVNDYGADPERVTVIHPGTVLSNFPDPKTRGPRKPGPLRVLFVGGDFVRKGGDLLLEVAKTRLKGKVELYLVTAADVPAEDGIFVYRGVKPHSPALLQRYAEADVFVLPTRGDCLAVVLGEAMASSLPIITTAVGAHTEAVEDGRSGFIVGVGDGRALGDKLEQLAGDPDLAARMGKRSREIGEARFDTHTNANRIADMLVDIAGGTGSASLGKSANGAPLDRRQAAQ
jgi:glycosyltransferase involved in cell wall biosynthesis